MKSLIRRDEFQIQRKIVREHGRSYPTFQLTGYLDGNRIRRRFTTLESALGEKSRLAVQAINLAGDIQPINTRLSRDQVAEAEVAFRRVGDKSLSEVIDWYLTNYKPPVAGTDLKTAVQLFIKEKETRLRGPSLKDYRRTLNALCAMYPGRNVHTITTAEVKSFLGVYHSGDKRFNNMRGDLNAFFVFCQSSPREWLQGNPVKPIPKFKISRGMPEIISAQVAKELMAFVEDYAGGPRDDLVKGSLVPYFSLCLFGGIRPSVRDGEMSKLAKASDHSKVIKLDLGVIQITPGMAKNKYVRQVKIQPNLAAWLKRYPLSQYPVMVPSMADHVAKIRKQFGLTNDVLRHTFISMHVAKFKSVGDAAGQAGNSERMTRTYQRGEPRMKRSS